MANSFDKYRDTYIDGLGDPNLLNRRYTWNRQSKNDFQWAKDCVEFIDSQHSCYGDIDNVNRVQMNYDLANGQGESAMNKYGEHLRDDLLAEGFTENDMYGNVQHHSVMHQVYNAMVGEQQLRPLNPMAIDTSGFAINDIKRKRLELSQEFLQEQIIAPKVAQITAQVQQQYAQEYGVKDIFSLNPEQQQQMRSDIEQRSTAMTPKEIQEFMRKDYKSPGAIQVQQILDFVMSDLEVKYITDENFKNLLIAGSEIYKVGIRHNRAYIDIVNPLGFYYMSRPNSLFIEDSVAWKYEQYVMLHDIQEWHGEEIGNSRLLKEKLDLLSMGSTRRKFGEPHPALVVEVQSGNTNFINQAPNLNTLEGQEFMKSVLGGLNRNKNRTIGDVKYVHTAWKALRKLKQIKRYNPDNDRIKSIWIDESYTFNPTKVDDTGYRDIEEYVVWAPRVWEGTRVDRDIYLGVGPVEYQYKSLDNPWVVRGPYVGGQYSKLMNNARNISPFDPAKSWQYKFNLQMKHIHELEATDLGKVLHAPMNTMPAGWDYKKQFLMMKYGKQYVTDPTQEGYDMQAMANGIKQMDLSSDSNIMNKLGYLDFLRAQIILAMNYNPSRLGLQGPTVAVTNNQQNIVQSSYQTNDIFNFHNKIVENLLNVAVDAEKQALRDNDAIKGFVLDDMSLANLELDWSLIDHSEIAVKIKNSSQEFQDLQEVKLLLQPMIQNGMMTVPDAIRIRFAKNAHEVMKIAEDSQMASEKRQAAAQEEQQKLIQRQEEMMMKMDEMEKNFQFELQKRDHANDLIQATISSSFAAQQKDIDRDGKTDDLAVELMKQEFELMKLDKEMNLKKFEIQEQGKMEEKRFKLEKEIAEKKIEIEKIKARKPKASS